MRAVLELEFIGADHFAYKQFGERVNPSYERRKWQMTKKGMRPWVARITGHDPRYGYAREFLHPVYDYTRATTTGARGIYLMYGLRPGLYEVNERISWQNHRRWFARVEGLEMTKITREELEECLNDTSASTS